jgi:hypothetical protein
VIDTVASVVGFRAEFAETIDLLVGAVRVVLGKIDEILSSEGRETEKAGRFVELGNTRLRVPKEAWRFPLCW